MNAIHDKLTSRRICTYQCLLGFIAAISTIAHASISQIEFSPTSGQISLSGNVPLNISWIVNTTTGGTVTSPRGIFRTREGEVLGTVMQPLSKAPSAGLAVLTEMARVPETISIKAKIMGYADIVYERGFSDGGTAVSASFPVHIATDSNVGLRIAALTFAFANNTPLASIGRGSTLRATAQLTFASNADTPSATPVDPTDTTAVPVNVIVRGVWEVAGPNPNIENPTFRRIGDLNEYVSGIKPTTLKAPLLPTDKPGTYLLRIDFTTPTLDFESPMVRYYVTEK